MKQESYHLFKTASLEDITKKLEDVSYFMPIVLAFGMTLWFIYGFFLEAIAIMVANTFGVFCCIILIIMKKRYS